MDPRLFHPLLPVLLDSDIQLLTEFNWHADSMPKLINTFAKQRVGISPDHIKSIITTFSDEKFSQLRCRLRIRVLAELCHLGLTAEHLLGWHGYKGCKEFYLEHRRALITLMLDRHLSPQDAIDSIHQLSSYQAKGIAKGFNREDVLGLNANQIKALIKLQDLHLTVAHLRSWQGRVETEEEGSIEFEDLHYNALSYLMRQCHETAECAIAKINGLNYSEAYGISMGLALTEVKGLSMRQLDTLLELQKYDTHKLTAEDLRKLNDDEFSEYHQKALIYLIMECAYKPDAAIDLINHITSFDARMLYEKEYTPEELKGFNHSQIDALKDKKLKAAGLTPAHMRGWISPCQYEFNIFHITALRGLIIRQGISPDEAISVINGLADGEEVGVVVKNCYDYKVGEYHPEIEDVITSGHPASFF